MRLTVRLFAGLRERAGTDRLEVQLEAGATVADLLDAMAGTPVGPLGPRACVVAVNRSYAGPTDPVRDGDEIALVPPVSGGAGAVRHVRVTADPLDLAGAAGAVRDPRAGAVVLFEGVTRDVPELRYEAYAEMAEEHMRRIGEEEAARHGLCAVAIEHRVGAVPLSEPSVVIAASAPHRGEAFAGGRALIDRIKAEAPIWKQEVTADGIRRVPGTLPPAAGAQVPAPGADRPGHGA
jgi:molybdopterin synthase catalytic subunit